MSVWYQDWFDSPFYEILYRRRDEDEAIDLIKNLINLLKPVFPCICLDVGCGIGRHAKVLNDFGFEVKAVDLSFKNIRKAKEFEKEGLEFYRHDMRDILYINYVDYVFNFFTSFGYFDTLYDERNAARSMALNLKPNGILIMDYLNANYVIDRLKDEEKFTLNDIDFEISRKISNDWVIKDIKVCEQDSCQMFHEKVKLYKLEDLIQLFSPFGLTFSRVFGNYALGPYDESTSPRMILEFKKQS
ncbi:MAG: class I SAM-dependent methyltransferase [Bacteroidota bacterium]|nr:class I SAM-dependent methyltransferase [Bacteroidota bacterium]